MAYYLLVEALKAGGGEDYGKQRNEFERALRQEVRRARPEVDNRPALPQKLATMKRPAWWNDDDDPLEGMPGRQV